MKTLLALISLAFASAASPQDLENSALTLVLQNNKNQVPHTVCDWVRVLKRFGKVVPVIVPFSMAPEKTDLENVRVLLAVSDPDPTVETESLKKKLFVGITLTKDKVRTVEFISQNLSTGEFDFGIVKNEKVQVAGDGRCFTCHKHRNPIFPAPFWSNTTSNLVNWRAFVSKLSERYQPLRDEFEKVLSKARKAKFQLTPAPLGDPFSDLLPRLDAHGTVETTWNCIDLRMPRPDSIRRPPVEAFDRLIQDANSNLSVTQVYWALKAEELQRNILHTSIENQVFEAFQQAAFPKVIASNELRPKEFKVPAKSELKEGKFGFDRGVLPDFNVVTRRIMEVVADFVDHDVLDDETLKKTLEYNEVRKRERAEPVPTKFLPSSPQAHAKESTNPLANLDLANLALPFDKRDGAFFIDELKKLAGLEEILHDRERFLALLQQVLLTNEIKKLSNKRTFPTRLELTLALGRAFDEVLKSPHFRRIPLETIEKGRFRRTRAENIAAAKNKAVGGACTRCHVGPDALIEFPFDPSSEDTLAKWLGTAGAPQSQKWLKRVRARLLDGSMPPSDEPEATEFTPVQRKALLQFIQETLE